MYEWAKKGALNVFSRGRDASCGSSDLEAEERITVHSVQTLKEHLKRVSDGGCMFRSQPGHYRRLRGRLMHSRPSMHCMGHQTRAPGAEEFKSSIPQAHVAGDLCTTTKLLGARDWGTTRLGSGRKLRETISAMILRYPSRTFQTYRFVSEGLHGCRYTSRFIWCVRRGESERGHDTNQQLGEGFAVGKLPKT